MQHVCVDVAVQERAVKLVYADGTALRTKVNISPLGFGRTISHQS
jgi:hypothetical protein